MLSMSLKRDIADDAVRYVGLLASQRTRYQTTKRQFYPIVNPDKDEIDVGIRQEGYYLRYQNDGISTFPMRKLKGRTIPMVIGGHLIFRKANNINDWATGTKTYWRRGKDGVLRSSIEQRRRWVHPGMAPKNFIEDGIQLAISKNQRRIDAELNRTMYRRFGL